jgi:hypothetical protein
METTEYGAEMKPVLTNVEEAPETKPLVYPRITNEGPSTMDKLKSFLSKKLLAIVLTAIFVSVNNMMKLGIDDATIKQIIDGVIIYILGQSAVDVASIVKGK